MTTVPLSSRTPMYRLLATSSQLSFVRLAGLRTSRTSLKTRDCGFSARIFRLSVSFCSRSPSRPLPRRFPTESLTRPRSQTTTSKALRPSSTSTLPPKPYRNRSSASTAPSSFQSHSSAASTVQFTCSCSMWTTPSRHHSKHKFSPPPSILTMPHKPSR